MYINKQYDILVLPKFSLDLIYYVHVKNIITIFLITRLTRTRAKHIACSLQHSFAYYYTTQKYLFIL